MTTVQLSIFCCGALWPGGRGPLSKCCWLCGPQASPVTPPTPTGAVPTRHRQCVGALHYLKKDSYFQSPLPRTVAFMSMNWDGWTIRECARSSSCNGFSVLTGLGTVTSSPTPGPLLTVGPAVGGKFQGVWTSAASPLAWTLNKPSGSQHPVFYPTDSKPRSRQGPITPFSPSTLGGSWEMMCTK